jgi:hypothetical protein
MKIRNGFVSNSSSSSFICAVRKTTHDEAIAKMQERERTIIEKTVFFKKAFGLELAVRGQMNDCGGNYSYTGQLYNDDDEEIIIKDEDGEEFEENLIQYAIEIYDDLCDEIEKDSFYASVDDGG